MTNDTPSLFRRWAIWFLPSFFMLYQYGMQVVPNMNMEYIKVHYLVNNFEIGLLGTFYLFPYVLLQIPVGILIDHLNVRKILTGAIFLFGVGSILIFYSNQSMSYFLYMLGQLCMGIAASTGFIGTLYLANLWLSKNAYKFAIGLTQMLSMSGVFLVVMSFNYLLNILDWSKLLFINAVFCFGLALLFWFIILDTKKTKSFELRTVVSGIKVLMQNKNLWICAIFVGCNFSHFIVLTNAWRVDFLELHYHISSNSATIDNGYSIFGYIVGAPLYGLLAKKIKNLGRLIFISSLLEFSTLFVCHLFIESIAIKIWFYMFLGFFTGSISLGFILIGRLVDKKMLAAAIGLVNMVQISCGMLLTPIVGEILDRSHGNYLKSTIPVMCVSFIGVLMALLLWRNHAKYPSNSD